MPQNFEDTRWYSYTSSTETMRTWVRRLKSYEEISSEFQSAFPEYKADFPYTLFVPEDRFSLFHKRNRQMLCLYEDHFVHLELSGSEVRTFSDKLTDVLYVEQGGILLNAWLKIVARSGTVLIRYNTVNDHLFKPIIERIRQGMTGSGSADNVVFGEDKRESSKFSHLISVNFKYMNYGRMSVRANDTVIGMVYQPERRIQEVRLFNKTFFRRYATDHLSILTEDELIMIKEDKRIKTDKDSRYGGVFTYIPRRQIHDISFISNPEDSQCIMEISLPENTRLVSEFSCANEELKQLQEYLG